jgi:hypothetical protein
MGCTHKSPSDHFRVASSPLGISKNANDIRSGHRHIRLYRGPLHISSQIHGLSRIFFRAAKRPPQSPRQTRSLKHLLDYEPQEPLTF